MKYYDTYLPYIIDDDYDWSYPAPEMQLLWRLDDLQDRLEELVAKDAPYRDEIITELIARGWSCENTCNIGEEPNKKDIPYYWSAAGREIDVSKSVCNNGNTVLQRCSVGSEEITLMVDDTIIEALNYNALVTDVSGIKKFVDDIEKKYNDKICGGI